MANIVRDTMLAGLLVQIEENSASYTVMQNAGSLLSKALITDDDFKSIRNKVLERDSKLILKTEEELTAEQVKDKLIKAVDEHMNTTVQVRGYDNIVTCASYKGDKDSIFNKEGTAAHNWRSDCYRKCYNVLNQVNSGSREIPTVEELLSELPKFNWGGVRYGLRKEKEKAR